MTFDDSLMVKFEGFYYNKSVRRIKKLMIPNLQVSECLRGEMGQKMKKVLLEGATSNS